MKSKYFNPESLIIHLGWTQNQIEKYLSILENATPETLRHIHKDAGIRMFEDNEPLDHEQAISVLIGGHDIRKEELFRILDIYIE